MKYKTINFCITASTGYIELNRADAGNKINSRMSLEIEEACQQVNQKDGMSLLVICSAGEIFSHGCEPDDFSAGSRACNAISAVEVVTLAAVNGDAFAEGLELALACDIRIASREARFCLPQIVEGRMPSSGATQRLPRLVGRGKALEMMFLANHIDATEAYSIGMVNRVVDRDVFREEIDAMVERIGSLAPIALRFAKEAVNSGMDMTLEQGLKLEADLYFLLHTTEDRIEGIRSFLDKKTPRFKCE